MNRESADAIAEFLRRGGQIRKVKETIAVTEEEVVAFLASCGLRVTYVPDDMKTYACGKSRLSASGLVALANKERLSRQLPPFAIRPAPRTTRRI
jgi:hypothetical protein